jgi:hypothetical protein
MRACAAPIALAALAGLLPGSAPAAKPEPSPGPVSGATPTVVWGQASVADEVAGRPLESTLALFRSHANAATLPPASGIHVSLATVAAHLRGDPGKLLLGKTRRIDTSVGPVYLVPTGHGWVCLQGATFATCHRGLLRAGIVWEFTSTSTGSDVIGIAADDVSRVVLVGGGRRWRAPLHDNLFVVSRRFRIGAVQHSTSLGSLVVSYRDGRKPRRVALP